jgi:hypothetical protein
MGVLGVQEGAVAGDREGGRGDHPRRPSCTLCRQIITGRIVHAWLGPSRLRPEGLLEPARL